MWFVVSRGVVATPPHIPLLRSAHVEVKLLYVHSPSPPSTSPPRLTVPRIAIVGTPVMSVWHSLLLYVNGPRLRSLLLSPSPFRPHSLFPTLPIPHPHTMAALAEPPPFVPIWLFAWLPCAIPCSSGLPPVPFPSVHEVDVATCLRCAPHSSLLQGRSA